MGLDGVVPARRGRPPGTDETPESLIRKELIAQLKLYRHTREMVQQRIESAGTALPAEDLAKFMDLLRRGIVELAKPIVAPARADDTRDKGKDDEDPAKILAGLIGQIG